MSNLDSSQVYYTLLGHQSSNHSHGHPYKMGLNIIYDYDEKFNYMPFYEGGVHFTTIEYIFALLRFGDNLCKITIPQDAQMFRIGNIYKCDRFVVESMEKFDDIAVSQLMGRGSVIYDHKKEQLLVWACKKGYLNTVRFLVADNVNVHYNNEEALIAAIRYKHKDIQEMLTAAGARMVMSTYLLYPFSCM